MTLSPPLHGSCGSNYPNYSSIVVANEHEQNASPIESDQRGAGHRRNVLVIFAAVLCLALTAFVTFVDNPSYLLGPLLEPYLDGDGSRARRKAIKALEKLQDVLEGSVIFDDSDVFCEAAQVWQQGLEPPLAVIEVASEADVQLAVPILAEIYVKRGIPFRVRSGGHSYGGFSTVKSGIVLSLSGLNDIWFDKSTGVAAFGPAVKVQDILDGILVPDRYGGVVGDCAGVAEGGFVLGGGYGYLSRKYGLGLDSVIRARVVLRDGTVTVASDTESPDLFWALRGAGQNMFGVVTQLEYQLHPSQDTQLFVSGDVPLDPKFLTAIGEKHAKAPGEFMFLLEGPVTKHGTTDAFLSWFGQDDTSLNDGEAYIKEHVMPLLPMDVADGMSVDRVSWSEMTREGGNFDGNLVRAWTGFLFEENNTEKVWAQIIEKLTSVCIGNPNLLVNIELWGGEIANTKPEDTAFFYRSAVFNVGLVLLVPTDIKHAEKIYRHSVRDVDKAWEHISAALEGVYTNYVVESLSEKDYARAYWGGNLERLEQLKQSYDPENIFHHPQSIRPSGNQDWQRGRI